jgi:ketosteroid isomerase-like protein
MPAEPDTREELIRAGHAAWERGDVETVLGMYDPEIEVYAPPEIGNPGTYRGVEGFLEWSGDWFEVWETFEQELVSVEPVGSRHVLARVNQTGIGKGSGIRIERGATYVYEIRDDLLVYMSLFFDDEHAVAHAREREASE